MVGRVVSGPTVAVCRIAKIAAVASIAALTVVTASPARAQVVPLTGICEFPISHEFPKVHGNRSHGLPPPAPYAEFFTGQVSVVITNLETGESVEAFSNSATFVIDEHSAYFRGQSVAFFDSRRGQVPKGAWVVNGNLWVTFDEDGRLTEVSGAVVRRDICAELA